MCLANKNLHDARAAWAPSLHRLPDTADVEGWLRKESSLLTFTSMHPSDKVLIENWFICPPA